MGSEGEDRTGTYTINMTGKRIEEICELATIWDPNSRQRAPTLNSPGTAYSPTRPDMVPRTGFEPVISGLKGRRARPLHQRGGNTISSIAKHPPPAADVRAGFFG